MFTGIIEELGTIAELKSGSEPSGGARLVIRARHVLSGKARLRKGESIAVNGVCLTARKIKARSFSADLSPETLERSNLKTLQAGSRVNLERPMTPSSRFGGHIVQGHVDGVGKLAALDPLPDGNYWFSVDIPTELGRYIVFKGSIALNGISLTVARLDGSRVGVAIIPYTYEQTNLADLQPGDLINIECDLLAKYAEKLMSHWEPSTVRKQTEKQSSPTLERLLEEGF
ncbi:MAG: riboflavin synthase [Acidobacteria bacterium]|nr:riboflavin synthase [Acidobacteriota bacterium]